jgi:hypothetical protein
MFARVVIKVNNVGWQASIESLMLIVVLPPWFETMSSHYDN